MARRRRHRNRRPDGLAPRGERRRVRHLSGVGRALRLIDDERWDEAIELLEETQARQPGRSEVLLGLMTAYREVGNLVAAELAARRLAAVEPENPDLLLALASLALPHGGFATATVAFRRLLARFPHVPQAAEVRHMLPHLEAHGEEMLAAGGFTGEDRWELAVLHEEVRNLLENGEYAETCRRGQALLDQRPGLVSVMNNVGEAEFRLGRSDEAIARAQNVLAIQPDNHHALSNLTRYLVFAGRDDEARLMAERVRRAENSRDDNWYKRAEALAYVDDPAGIREIYRQYVRAAPEVPPPLHAMMLHLAGYAAAREGDAAEARRLWHSAQKADPALELPRANLADLNAAAEQRHGPWPLSINHWLLDGNEDWRGEVLQHTAEPKDDAGLVARIVRKQPTLVNVVPLMLRLGDPIATKLGAILAAHLERPELREALREFICGRRGSDQLRIELAHLAHEKGIFEPGPVKMWRGGQPLEAFILGYEITHDPVFDASGPAHDLIESASEAMKEGDYQRAERDLKQAVVLEPDSPVPMNNLAGVCSLRGRAEEAEQLIRELHARFPDYFHGIVNFATLEIAAGRLDRAREMLGPLLAQRRLHITQFQVLCRAQIELLLAEGNLEAARSWFDFWEAGDSDYPELEHYRQRLEPRPHRP